MKTIVLRLRPGQDLFLELEKYIHTHQIFAACVLTCVGSLTEAHLRYANCQEATTLTGHFEIVSLTGVMSVHGSHYHIAMSDGEGRTYGAHLLEGTFVYTTAEIVLGLIEGMEFLRSHDDETGYPELDVQAK